MMYAIAKKIEERKIFLASKKEMIWNDMLSEAYQFTINELMEQLKKLAKLGYEKVYAIKINEKVKKIIKIERGEI